MSELRITVDRFRELAEERFHFLEEKGFRRMKNLEETETTFGTIVYLGKNIGFVFSLDLRDQCVDNEVVKVENGELKPNLKGGYSSGILTHLIKHEGYRGGFGSKEPIAEKDNEAVIRRMIDDLADFLKGPGSNLLNDLAESLPKKKD